MNTFITKVVRAYQASRVRKAEGFTLVEALAGIFILTIVIGGPMTIAGRAAQDIRVSKEIFSATYLAQEVVELLRFKRDSLFLECSDSTSPNCALSTFSGSSGPVTEFPNEAAWRLFKTQLGSAGNTLCFSPEGCSFDAYSILSSPIATPPDIFLSTSNSCSTLYQDKESMLQAFPNRSAQDFMYFCAVHKPADATDSMIKRVVKIVSSSTATLGSYDALYGDELRVDVTVYFNYRGFTRTVLVTDYIKPRS